MGVPSILTVLRDDGVATVTLNRPELHNAFNDETIAELTAAFKRLGDDGAVRAVLLRGSGPSFSAGADLNWMRRMAGYSTDQNVADAMQLAELMRILNDLPKPTLAMVHGAAIAGGIGLVACCDIAIAADSATFAISEVKLGLIPAVISPYVIAAIGERAARRYFVTAERFSAMEAQRLGLVHEVVPAHMLEAAAAKVLKRVMEGAPGAQRAAKDLIRAVANRRLGDELIRDTAERIARARAGEEGRAGVAAFLGKEKAPWIQPD
jgi:methylglutaconyl-CoA hydratase